MRESGPNQAGFNPIHVPTVAANDFSAVNGFRHEPGKNFATKTIDTQEGSFLVTVSLAGCKDQNEINKRLESFNTTIAEQVVLLAVSCGLGKEENLNSVGFQSNEQGQLLNASKQFKDQEPEVIDANYFESQATILEENNDEEGLERLNFLRQQFEKTSKAWQDVHEEPSYDKESSSSEDAHEKEATKDETPHSSSWVKGEKPERPSTEAKNSSLETSPHRKALEEAPKKAWVRAEKPPRELESSKEPSSVTVDNHSTEASLKDKESDLEKDPIKEKVDQFSTLLDTLKDSDVKFSRTKDSNRINVKADLSSKIVRRFILTEGSKRAFEGFLATAKEAAQKHPLQALQLLTKLESSAWGKRALSLDNSLKKDFETIYQSALSYFVTTKETFQKYPLEAAQFIIKLEDSSLARKLLSLDSSLKENLEVICNTALSHLAAATDVAQKYPLETAQLIIKLEDSPLAKKVLSLDSSLREELEVVYNEAIVQCASETRAIFSSTLKAVTTQELKNNEKFASKPGYEKACPNLAKLTELSNMITNSLISKILDQTSINARVKMIDFYAKIAKNALENGDYTTALAIYSGIQSGPIGRLEKHFDLLPDETKEIIKNLTEAFKGSNLGLEKLLLAKKNNPSLIAPPNSTLSSLIQMAEKRNNAAKTREESMLVVSFIDIYSQDETAFVKTLESLNEEIAQAQQTVADMAESPERLKLSYKISDLTVQRSLLLKVSKFNEYIQLQDSGTSLETHKESLQNKLKDIDQQINETTDESTKKQLQNEKNYIQQELNIALDLYSTIKNLKTANPQKNNRELLQEYRKIEEESARKAEAGIALFQAVLDRIPEDFKILQNGLSDDEPPATSSESWFFKKTVSKDSFDKEAYAKSKEVEPSIKKN